MRRNRTAGELAFYRCYAPEPVTLARLVTVAGHRWRVEESFQQGKGLAGLDEHQVRTWTSWHRWSLLAMVAYAFVALCRLRETRHHLAPEGLVALTCNEIARLFHALFGSEPVQEHVLAWSVFRRSHQAQARDCHYRRQTARERSVTIPGPASRLHSLGKALRHPPRGPESQESIQSKTVGTGKTFGGLRREK